MPIRENLSFVKDNLATAAVISGRKSGEILIVAVSKNRGEAEIVEAFNVGCQDFGENKIQEAAGKKFPVGSAKHFIGRLQSNKVKKCVEWAHWIHSIDSLELAGKVDAECLAQGKRVKALIQVNVTGEESKAGVRPFAALQLAEVMAQMQGLELMGLMTMAERAKNPEDARAAFKQLGNLLSLINSKLGLELRELSMGMSQDYVVAVEEGATIIRVGAAIFG